MQRNKLLSVNFLNALGNDAKERSTGCSNSLSRSSLGRLLGTENRPINFSKYNVFLKDIACVRLTKSNALLDF